MRASCLLLVSCLALAAGAQKSSNRIVGGSVTTIAQYPFAASLLIGSRGGYIPTCGGTILNNRAILTSGGCVDGSVPINWLIRVGSVNSISGGATHYVNSIIRHPQFNRNTLDNDVAILRANSAFAFNNNVRAGSIAGSNYNLADNQVVWAIGWGWTSFAGQTRSNQLRHVQIWTVNQNTCRNRYAEVGLSVTANMLCAGWLDVGGRDACNGDSGGPLLHNNVIVGIISWRRQCALPRYPGVNTRVSRYTSWIQNNA